MSKITDSERIQKRIKKLGLQKKFIAERVLISQSELSHIIHAKRIYPEKRRRLMEFLGLKY